MPLYIRHNIYSPVPLNTLRPEAGVAGLVETRVPMYVYVPYKALQAL